jgi:hypothetical protein
LNKPEWVKKEVISHLRQEGQNGNTSMATNNRDIHSSWIDTKHFSLLKIISKQAYQHKHHNETLKKKNSRMPLKNNTCNPYFLQHSPFIYWSFFQINQIIHPSGPMPKLLLYCFFRNDLTTLNQKCQKSTSPFFSKGKSYYAPDGGARGGKGRKE